MSNEQQTEKKEEVKIEAVKTPEQIIAEKFADVVKRYNIQQGSPEYKQLQSRFTTELVFLKEEREQALNDAVKRAYAEHRPWHTPSRTMWNIVEVGLGTIVGFVTMAGVAVAAGAVNARRSGKKEGAFSDTSSAKSKFQPIKVAK